MKYIELCNKILSHQQIKFEELTEFLAAYCEKTNKPNEMLNTLIQGVQQHQVNLSQVIQEYYLNTDVDFCSLYDKNGYLLKQFVYEDVGKMSSV